MLRLRLHKVRRQVPELQELLILPDSQMLLQAKYSFVMENANEDMKPFGNFIAPSNDDDGVMRMIKKYVLDARR